MSRILALLAEYKGTAKPVLPETPSATLDESAIHIEPNPRLEGIKGMLKHLQKGISMARQATKLEEWQIEACRLMAAHDLSLREAAAELGITLSIAEADAIQKRVLFKEALEKAKQEHYAQIGANPALSKDLIVGMALKLAERLAADREDYKASDALLKLAKIKGWVGSEPDTLWQTISQLSHNEIQEVRRNLQEKIEEQQREQSQPASSDKPQQPAEPQQVN